MSNLHRKLAPISDDAWAQIEEEAGRTLKRYLGARRVVDVNGPLGYAVSAIGTGHQRPVDPITEGVQSAQREVNPLVELRVPFALLRRAIDDVARGSNDSDWQPLKDAARTIAFAEDRAVFEGYSAAGIGGIRAGSSNAAVPLPAKLDAYPEAIARALNVLKRAGCNGPYALVLGADAYLAASGGNEEGYPIFHHIERIVDGGVIWAPAIEGGFLVTTRGGDFELDLGQDISIGYLSHDATTVELYLQESFTFRMLTSEAAVTLSPRSP